MEPTPTTVGIRLRPGWARQVLGVAISELPEVVAVEEIWGVGAYAWQDRLRAVPAPEQHGVLVDLVAQSLDRGAKPDHRVLSAVSLLAEGESVAATAATVGLSPRHLRRRFELDVGMGPKALQRVQRFRRLYGMAQRSAGRSWSLAQFAAHCGYADESHLVRDCRQLAGQTPRALLRATRTAPPPSTYRLAGGLPQATESC